MEDIPEAELDDTSSERSQDDSEKSQNDILGKTIHPQDNSYSRQRAMSSRYLETQRKLQTSPASPGIHKSKSLPRLRQAMQQLSLGHQADEAEGSLSLRKVSSTIGKESWRRVKTRVRAPLGNLFSKMS